MFAMLLLAATAAISWNFDGGSADKADRLSDTHFRVWAHGQTDQDGRNRQASWYYFRVDNATPGAEYTIDMVGLPGEYNYQPNKGAIQSGTVPVVSSDQLTWTYLDRTDYDPKEPRLTLHVRAPAARFWIAHVPPYTNAQLEQLRKLVKHEEVIGKSVEGRPLYLWTIEPPAGVKPKATVWLMFRQHAWEAGSSWVGDGAMRSLLKDARGIRWKILPFADPDGVAHGGVRFNRNGFDLNRNWDVVDPVKMPEITAQRNAIAKWLKAGNRIDLFFSLHNTETAEYLEAQSPEHKDLAERYFKALTTQTSFAPTRPLFFGTETTTAGKPGRMNVIQGLWRDFKVPGFLMEQHISSKPTIEQRVRFGEELVSAIAGLFR
jgi:hypothetical protein